MLLFDFLYKKYPWETFKACLLLLIGGIAHVLPIILLNSAIAAIMEDKSIIFHAVLVILAILFMYHYQKKFFDQALALFTISLSNLRKDIVRKIIRTNLAFIEKAGLLEVQNQLTAQLDGIYEYLFWVAVALTMMIRFLIGLLYVCSISFIAGITLAGGFLIAAIIFHFYVLNKVKENRQTYTEANHSYLHVLNDTLLGAKELRLSEQKHQALLTKQKEYSQRKRDIQSDFLWLTSLSNLYNTPATFGIAGTMSLVVSSLTTLSSVEISQILTMLFFMTYAATAMYWGFEYLYIANEEFRSIIKTNLFFDQHSSKDKTAAKKSKITFEESITLQNVSYEYPNTRGATFGIGPINLKLKKGEVIFLIGQNGSGKSTFLKTFTGLYDWQGEIKIDQTVIDEQLKTQYQDMFSIVLTDFHLFDELYSIKKAKPKKVRQLLKLMQLDHKTSFKQNSFTNLDLSTGQKKRLALIVAFLEQKEIYILDEVAANQDTSQKLFFYDFILRDLRNAGKTVLVVSHDKEYFEYADRVIEIKNGEIMDYQFN